MARLDSDLVAVSPPHLLGYANGIAQSIVSFARFVGPILGGYVSIPLQSLFALNSLNTIY